MAAQELSFKINADPSVVKAAMAQVRAEITQTAAVQQSAGKSELSLKQQLAAAAQLDKQRMAAALVEFKKMERAQEQAAKAAARHAAGQRSLSDEMRLLSSTMSAIQGPMGGIASRISALTTLTNYLSGATKEAAGASTEASQATSAYASSLSSAAGPVGAAILVAVALDAAVIGLAKSLFDATKSAADFKGKMFDLSQQTGVSVETLSALEVMARTTGGSIETITASLGIFQRNLEQAHDPTSKEAKLLNELGVETNNTEEALRQTLTSLAKMPEGFTQTSRALELFGRGGKSILAILKEMHGDLDGAIGKFRDMGILISTEDARAADEFNDQLAILEFQLRSMVAVIGSELMPAMRDAVVAVSKMIKENREELKALAEAIKVVVVPVINNFIQVMHGAVVILNVAVHAYRTGRDVLLALADGYDVATAALRAYNNEQARQATESLGATGAAEGVGAPSRRIQSGIDFGVSSMAQGPAWTRRRSGGGGGGRGGRSGGGASAEDREFEQRQKRITDYTLALTDAYNKLDAEIDGVNTSTKLYAVQQDILNGVLREATVATQQQALRDAQEIDNKTNLIRLRKELVTYAERLQEVVRQNIEGDKSYLRQSQELIESLEKQGAVLGPTTTAWLQIMGGMAAAKDTAAAMIPIIASLADELTKIPLFDKSKNVLSNEQVDALGSPPPPPELVQATSAIDQLRQHLMEGLGDDVTSPALAGLDALTTAFSGLGQAVGQVVEAWVLYGAAGTSVRKVTAQILASIAQQAAVKAVFELAEGFAALAMAFLGMPQAGPSASAHFTAAAIYGGIAVGAAVAGRAVAGNAFTSAAGGGGSAGGSSAGSSARPSAPGTIDVGRRKAEGAPEVHVKLTLAQGLHEVVEAHVVNNWRSNGQIRTTIQEDR